MVNSIDVIVRNGMNVSLKAQILFKKNICYINNNKYDITDDFKEEFLDTIYSWRHEYGTDDNIDSKEFLITVNADDGEEKFHGKGIFPENYSIIEEMLSETNE